MEKCCAKVERAVPRKGRLMGNFVTKVCSLLLTIPRSLSNSTADLVIGNVVTQHCLTRKRKKWLITVPYCKCQHGFTSEMARNQWNLKKDLMLVSTRFYRQRNNLVFISALWEFCLFLHVCVCVWQVPATPFFVSPNVNRFLSALFRWGRKSDKIQIVVTRSCVYLRCAAWGEKREQTSGGSERKSEVTLKTIGLLPGHLAVQSLSFYIPYPLSTSLSPYVPGCFSCMSWSRW